MNALHMVDSDHVRSWLQSGRAFVADIRLSRDLAVDLDGRAWAPGGTKLDWSQLNGVSTSISDGSAVAEWLEMVEPGRSEWAFVLFSPREPGLVCGVRDAISEADFLFWRCAGTNFMCGLTERDGTFDLELPRIMEFDGLDLVTAGRRAESGEE